MVWGVADDAKLKALFGRPPSKGGVDPTDLTVAGVRAVKDKHWPTVEYKNFAPLYHRKARAFNVGKTLGGKRRKCTCNKLTLFLVFFTFSHSLLVF